MKDEYIIRVSRPEQWVAVAEDGDVRVTVRRTLEGSDINIENITPYGLRGVEAGSDLLLRLTGNGHAVLVAAMREAGNFYPYRKVPVK